MNIVDGTGSRPPFLGNELKFGFPRFGRSLIKYPALIQHSPQSTRVRHIKDLLGFPICSVETEDSNNLKNFRISFPPNNYDEIKIRDASRRLPFLPTFSNTNVFVAARPTFDTVFSLNHFTGLRNTSFKNKSNFSMKRINTFDGWENQLESLASCALEPLLDDKSDMLSRPRTMESKILCPVSPMRRMYSSSGRILQSGGGNSRPLTCPSRRPTSKPVLSRSIVAEQSANDDYFNSQVFNIIGGILQTSDDEVIKTWLLTATEREKALMIDILRSALYNKEEMNIFVKDPIQEEGNLIYTPNNLHKSKTSSVPENTDTEKTDVLIVHPEPTSGTKEPLLRPPTSSVFRPSTKDSLSRPRTRESTWVPNESIAIP